MNKLEQHAMEMLRRDPMTEANDDVGKALGIQIALSAEKEDVFSVLGDTHFQIPYAEAIRGLKRSGYQKIFSEDFGDREILEAWWHDGVLVVTESYAHKRVNRIQAYYNWAPAGGDIDLTYRIAESGGFVKNIGRRIWCGYVDGRAGLHTHIKRLRENGEILTQWVETPFLWLVNYSEENNHAGKDYAAINARKLGPFPAWLRKNMALGCG